MSDEINKGFTVTCKCCGQSAELSFESSEEDAIVLSSSPSGVWHVTCSCGNDYSF